MLALKLATCMTENSESFCHAAAQFIENRTRIRTEYIANVPWQDRERLFDSGEIDIPWLYGLPYVDKADSRESGVELLAVPVPRGERYGGRPIYFSDVVVRRERKFATFFDLRGASWAYNEPRSHSGFNVIRAYLAEFRQFAGFFGMVIESGARSVSLDAQRFPRNGHGRSRGRDGRRQHGAGLVVSAARRRCSQAAGHRDDRTKPHSAMGDLAPVTGAASL